MPAQTPSSESSLHTGLLEALPVTANATTSRLLVNNPVLRVVLFAMDAGQELTEHSSPRHVVVQVLSGSLDFTVDGSRQPIAAGDVAYLAPDARHALVAISACRFALTMVDAAAP